jgi:hypothetical protein
MRTLILAALLAGCGSAQGQAAQPVTATRRDGAICKSEAPTGSHLPRTRCRTGEQIEQEREAARRERSRQ